jgi:DNA polymerase elongation subunit (family B)
MDKNVKTFKLSDTRLPSGVISRTTYARTSNEQRFMRVARDVSAGEPFLFRATDVNDATFPYRTSNDDRVSRQAIEMTGVTEDKRKIRVMAMVCPFFDIVADSARARLKDPRATMPLGVSELKDILCDVEENAGELRQGILGIKTVKGRPGFKFRKSETDLWRVYFTTQFVREKVFKRVRDDLQLETVNDDMNRYYYRKYARENGLSLTGLVEVRRYREERWMRGRETHSPDIDVFSVDLDYKIWAEFRGHPKNPAWRTDVAQTDYEDAIYSPDDPWGLDPQAAKEWADRVKSIEDGRTTATFDIETCPADPTTGAVPQPDVKGDECFMIGMSFHAIDKKDAIQRICLVSAPCNDGSDKDAEYLTIVCTGDTPKEREACLTKAFWLIISAWTPDIITGFNDASYDWPWMLALTRERHDLGRFAYECASSSGYINEARVDKVIDDIERRKKYKISADLNTEGVQAKFKGIIPVDVRIRFQQLYSKDDSGIGKSSLNHYLRRCGLQPKDDVPYTDMWRAYKEGDADLMAKVAHYCVIDAQRCQELLLAKSVIQDREQMSRLSYVSLEDSFIFADSMKVENLVAGFAFKRRFFFAQSRKNEALPRKFPGAHVFDSLRGRYTRDPITGLDFSSLYPSIIRAYNLCPTRYVTDPEEAKRLRAEGYELREVFLPDFGGVDHRGWFVRHGGDRSQMGVYPLVLDELFGTRKVKKAEWQNYSKELEVFDAETVKLEAVGISPAVAAERTKRRADLKRYHDNAFIEQNAVKVFMNTFYGVAGSVNSWLFLLLLAFGTTAGGKENILKVADYLIANGFKIHYGDTDSVYVSPNPEVFAELDKRYEDSQKTDSPMSLDDWGHERVRITMKVMAVARDEVNVMLENDNGTKYLSVAYEEVLFPCLLAGKKKYCGVAHEATPNLHPKKLFIRGLELIKQGNSEMLISISNQILWTAMDLREKRSMLEITLDVLTKAMQPNVWSQDHFLLSKCYKPHKNNVTVNKFVARMRTRYASATPEMKALSEPPTPGVRFKYVIVKNSGDLFDMRGLTNKDTKVGDKMEYAGTAQALNMPIDIGYYLNNSIAGACARVCNHDRMFNEGCEGLDPEELDKASQKAAVKYIRNFIASKQTGVSKELKTKLGHAYRSAYNRAVKSSSLDLVRVQQVGVIEQVMAAVNEELKPRIVIDRDLVLRARGISKDGKDLKGEITHVPLVIPDVVATTNANLYEAVKVYSQSNKTSRYYKLRSMAAAQVQQATVHLTRTMQAVQHINVRAEAAIEGAVQYYREEKHKELRAKGFEIAEIAAANATVEFELSEEERQLMDRLDFEKYKLGYSMLRVNVLDAVAVEVSRLLASSQKAPVLLRKRDIKRMVSLSATKLDHLTRPVPRRDQVAANAKAALDTFECKY